MFQLRKNINYVQKNHYFKLNLVIIKQKLVAIDKNTKNKERTIVHARYFS